MKRRLGISLYPNYSEVEEDKKYIELAAKYGFSRMFISMLEVEGKKEDVLDKFRQVIKHAKDHDFEVILDVAPNIFEMFDITYDDLTFFKELYADGIRLDAGFDGKKEAEISFNPEELAIELNMSNDVAYLDNILTHQANEPFIYGCHNFYPQNGTGLPLDFFTSSSERFKKHGIRTAAFISSQHGDVGPWDINDGLVTVEMHRELPIDVQAKHLFSTNLIDDVVIGNAYATEDELKALAEVNPYQITIAVDFVEDASVMEKEVVLDNQHFRRGDITDRMIRSTEVRKKYINEENPAHDHTQTFERGDIVIGNDAFGKYKNELQVVLEPHEDARKNLVAKIRPEELILLDYIKPWTKFKFTQN